VPTPCCCCWPGQREAAEKQFLLAFHHMLGPFRIWTELDPTVAHGTGNLNFLTGAGAISTAPCSCSCCCHLSSLCVVPSRRATVAHAAPHAVSICLHANRPMAIAAGAVSTVRLACWSPSTRRRAQFFHVGRTFFISESCVHLIEYCAGRGCLGAGGFLENLVFGYGGVKHTATSLELTPSLPPLGVTAMTLRGQ